MNSNSTSPSRPDPFEQGSDSISISGNRRRKKREIVGTDLKLGLNDDCLVYPEYEGAKRGKTVRCFDSVDDGRSDLRVVGTVTNVSKESNDVSSSKFRVSDEDGSRQFGERCMDIDLNVADWISGSKDCQFGAGIAQCSGEIILIDSDKDQSDHDLLVNKGGDKAKTEDIGGRFVYGSKGSFGLGLEEVGPSVCGSRREEKRKEWLSLSSNPVLDVGSESENSTDIIISSLYKLKEEVTIINKEFQPEEEVMSYPPRRARALEQESQRRREKYYEIAREQAHQYAHYESSSQDNEKLSLDDDMDLEDIDGPFSTALKVITERNLRLNAKRNSLSDDGRSESLIQWVPSSDASNISLHPVPSLLDQCTKMLAKNASAIVSLECVPDSLKHQLSQLVCDSRKMDVHFMGLLISGSPTEIRVRNCSWMTEEQLTNIFRVCDTTNLTVLQLDLCGRCMTDYILHESLAREVNSLPSLAAISLRGACRFSDKGLTSLVKSAPLLQSINLSQCSLISSKGICSLTDSLGCTLRELYIDDCETIDPVLILPALKQFKHMEVLSVAGIKIYDDFVCEIVDAHGPHMKELVLANCVKLTNISLKHIGRTCSNLRALDLSNLQNLTDRGLQFLANGCRSIEALKLCRNNFSDEAIAAFLEASGSSLNELSLNNIRKVGPSTAFSLAKCSNKLLSLDLSWCRNITDEALGLIVDSCFSLRLLKLFGCTQITDMFLNGHSNSLVRILGLKLTPILEHLYVLEPQRAPLRYSPLI